MAPSELAQFLLAQSARLPALPVVTGFDGFVDEMISVVDRRHSLSEFDRIDTIASFGEKISAHDRLLGLSAGDGLLIAPGEAPVLLRSR